MFWILESYLIHNYYYFQSTLTNPHCACLEQSNWKQPPKGIDVSCHSEPQNEILSNKPLTGRSNPNCSGSSCERDISVGLIDFVASMQLHMPDSIINAIHLEVILVHKIFKAAYLNVWEFLDNMVNLPQIYLCELGSNYLIRLYEL